MITRDSHGHQHWQPGNEKPPVVYSPSNAEIRYIKTIEGTARLLAMSQKGCVLENDYKKGLEINAERLGITVEQLHSEALSLLESEDPNSETSRIS